MRLEILFEDNHLLVVNKPAGLPTQGADEGQPSLVTEAKAYLKKKYQKPGNVFLGVVSRLDALVTGVIVLARTSKAAARLNEQFRDADVEKVYWAATDQSPPAETGTCEDWLVKDDSQQRMVIVAEGYRGAQRARLHYQWLDQTSTAALLCVRLETGRKHQIRVQLAALGCPIIGDKKYGSRRLFASGIALHARQLTIKHPTREDELTFSAPVPASWDGFGFAE